jgi:hypothetical protein
MFGIWITIIIGIVIMSVTETICDYLKEKNKGENKNDN